MRTLLILFLFASNLYAEDQTDAYTHLKYSMERKIVSIEKILDELAANNLDINVDIPSKFFNYQAPGKRLAPIHILAMKAKKPGYEELLRLWVNLPKVKLNIQDDFGNTALMKGIECLSTTSSYAAITILIDAGAKIKQQNYGDTTALMLCAKDLVSSSTKVMGLLLNGGAKVNRKNRFGVTALMFAAQQASSPYSDEIVAILLQAKAKVDLEDDCDRSALHYVLASAAGRSVNGIVKQFIAGGAKVNRWSRLHNTPLLLACEHAVGADVIEQLLEAGAKVNVSSIEHFHKTPLMLACLNSTNGQTTVRKLIEAGANIEAVDRFTETALFYAVNNTDLEAGRWIVANLIRVGANVMHKTKEGIRVWDRQKFGHPGLEVIYSAARHKLIQPVIDA